MKNAELVFNQHMIQDYLDCKRRFQLRYLQKLEWPALLTSDQIAFEHHIRQGVDFHRLVQQSILNIPEDKLLAGISNPDIHHWWQVFVSHFPEIAHAMERNPEYKYLAEYPTRGSLGEDSLFAKYDLLVIDPGKQIWIYDWKTTQSPISPHKYLNRAQTRIYRWLMVISGSVWNFGHSFPPEKISLTYWSPSQADDPVVFQYDAEQYQADRIWLEKIIQEIRSLTEDQFDKTTNESSCIYCNFRSLCHRGNKPGSSEDLEKQTDLEDLDISSIEAIKYKMQQISSSVEWVIASEEPIPADLLHVAGENKLVAQILLRRGIKTVDKAAGFLDPSAYQPASPYEFPGMDKAIERIRTAIQIHERMLIWGDFDVDGQTSTTILVSTLRKVGGEVDYHIPVRDTEGHGIHPDTLKLYLDGKYKLIITCDTGISAIESIRMMIDAGVDVIVTDHHELPDELPGRTIAMINPRFLTTDHPLSSLPGCGVAYELACALLESYELANFHQELLDLVALGIVADVAEQVGDTRYLLQMGLRQLRLSQRTGLLALLVIAEVEQSTLTEEHIGFQLTPRLNALGRLSDANLAVEFFLTQDVIKAQYYASELDGLNVQRKLLTDQVLQAALQQIENNPNWLDSPILVVGQEGWPGGVLGIVASHLVQRYNKPAIVLQLNPNGTARGSARSIPGIHITEAIKAQQKLLTGFGGHPMAAGLALSSELVPDFRQMITHTIQELSVSLPREEIHIDAVIPISDVDLDFTRGLEILSPFGNGNPAPNLVAKNLSIIQAGLFGKTKDHVIIQVEEGNGNQMDVIWWQGAGQPLPDARFDLLYHTRASVYRGEERLQLEWIDYRINQESVTVPSTRNKGKVIDFRFFLDNEELLNNFRAREDTIIWAEGGDRKRLDGKDRLELIPVKCLVIWSTPPSPDVLARAIGATSAQEIVLFCLDPGLDDTRALISRLVGLLRGFAPAGGIPISIFKLAAACAQKPATITAALNWLSGQGEIQIKKIDHDEVVFDWKQGKPAINILELSNRLERDLQETAAYRKHLTEISINDWRFLIGSN